jgi:hypothetical protein
MAPNADKDTIRANWRCFLACGLMLATPFQYGLDFGLIGGLQAMRGFLQVGGHVSRFGTDHQVLRLTEAILNC